MTESDRKDFAELIADVYGFYGDRLSKFALSLWWEACRPYPLATVRRAVTKHATDPERGSFTPKPADILRHLGQSKKDDALLAWRRVLEQVSAVGRNGTPRLTDAEREALAGIGGWQRLCNSDESEVGFLMRDFCAMYRAVESFAEHSEMLAADPEVQRIAGEAIGRIAYGGGDAG